MPRTTIDLDTTVLRELRRRGTQEGKSMGRLASELLAAALADPEQASKPQRFEWKAADLGEPLVDLDDKDALHAALEDPAA